MQVTTVHRKQAIFTNGAPISPGALGRAGGFGAGKQEARGALFHRSNSVCGCVMLTPAARLVGWCGRFCGACAGQQATAGKAGRQQRGEVRAASLVLPGPGQAVADLLDLSLCPRVAYCISPSVNLADLQNLILQHLFKRCAGPTPLATASRLCAMGATSCLTLGHPCRMAVTRSPSDTC
jgi:hypothetical protein